VEIPSICKLIIDCLHYPVVFVDLEHIIRYLNPAAEHHYYRERGYSSLVGKSIFECHSQESREGIARAVESFKKGEQEIFLKVNVRNQRVYITPVRDENGNLVGYYERFELNLQK
jgi:DUF438 domain-containing protein